MRGSGEGEHEEIDVEPDEEEEEEAERCPSGKTTRETTHGAADESERRREKSEAEGRRKGGREGGEGTRGKERESELDGEDDNNDRRKRQRRGLRVRNEGQAQEESHTAGDKLKTVRNADEERKEKERRQKQRDIPSSSLSYSSSSLSYSSSSLSYSSSSLSYSSSSSLSYSSSSSSSSVSSSPSSPTIFEPNVLFENEVKRNPFRIKVWLSYLQTKPKATDRGLNLIAKTQILSWRVNLYERSLKNLPGSFKLWLSYIKECVAFVSSDCKFYVPRRNENMSSKLLPPGLLSKIKASSDSDHFYLPSLCLPSVSKCTVSVDGSGDGSATSQEKKDGDDDDDDDDDDESHSGSSSGSSSGGNVAEIGNMESQERLTVESVNELFERCLVYHSRKPRIWLLYCSFLQSQNLITRTRRTYNRCLRSIPLTQHEMIWNDILSFLKKADVELTALVMLRRYVMINPAQVETLIDFLKEKGRWNEAAEALAKVINDDDFISIHGKTKHELWMELCELLSSHPESIRAVKVEEVLRCGLMRFTDEVGRLWCSLADHFIRFGFIERARDVYEEAIVSVSTLHDFAIVFDAYAAFEESLIAAKLEEDLPDDKDADANLEMDIYMTRLERLMKRRPELVSSVKLRQNPHNVNEWLHRVSLFRKHPVKVIETFSDAVRTVSTEKAVGRVQTLWTRFARYYEEFDDLENARIVWSRATQVSFRSIDELASIWCEWVEMELRHKQYAHALKIARQSVHKPANADADSSQSRLYRSVKLWSMCADIEESFGTIETVRACYDKMFALKVVTPQLVINFAQYLQDHRYFEESFKAYERGISLFRWPHLNDIYLTYLTKVVERFGSSKLERARELFEQAVANVPPKCARRLYLLYAKLEEEFGLAKHALRIYERACAVVTTEEKFNMFTLYIAKTAELFGVVKTRPIYEKAIEDLPDEQVKKICLQYALVEKGLGEVDRARAIYSHASQVSDPNRDPDFWRVWREFEVAHGNEETFRDMLRIKRSVQAQYSQVHFNAAELVAESAPTPMLNPMAAAERELEVQEEISKNRQIAEEANGLPSSVQTTPAPQTPG